MRKKMLLFHLQIKTCALINRFTSNLISITGPGFFLPTVMFTTLLSLILFIQVLSISFAKFSSGVLSSDKNWEYLDRFCFVSQEGTFQYNVQYPVSFELQSIYMYYDSDDQWRAAYGNNSLSCRQRERLLDPTNHQIIRLAPSAKFIDEHSHCETISRDNESWYRCIGKRSFFSMRPRWWYFAVGNCDSQHGLYLHYSMMMTNAREQNGSSSRRWHYQFSFDEFYSLPFSLFFLLLQFILFCVACVFAYVLRARKMLHITFRLFLHSLFCELISALLLWLHFDRYADDGRGLPLLKLFSLILRQFSLVLFVLLLFLIAKGFTITRARISLCSSLKIILFVSAYFILRLLMLGWEIIIFDPAQVTYMSESLPAYFICALNILGWLWFMRSSWVTAKKYPMKRRFYSLFTIFGTLWFWSSPVVLVVANFVLDNWVREEVVQGMDSAIVAAGYVFFLALTCPFSKAKHFPYHVRTNQIGNHQNNFPHNIYEVQYSTTAAQMRENIGRGSHQQQTPEPWAQ